MTASDLVIVGVAFAAGCFFLYILIRTIESRFLHLPQVKRARQVERLQQEVDALQKLVREAPRETQSAPPQRLSDTALEPLSDAVLELRDSVDQLRVDAAERPNQPYPEQF